MSGYQLPATHTLELDSSFASDELADFLIALAGLLDGVRLTRNTWTHLLKAPIKIRTLGDLYCDDREIAAVLKIASDTWTAEPADVRLRLFGAIHWVIFSALYEFDFERFAGFYSVMDTLYWVYQARGGKRLPHGARAEGLATHFGMQIPPWAVTSNGSCALSELRNELVHEARYAGAPTGFAFPTNFPGISLELECFVRRMILAALRVRCRYATSEVTTRQVHGLDLI